MQSFTFSGSLAGRSVRRIGFGAMQLPGPGVFGPPRDRDEALAVLRRAVELGVNHIDTSQYYGPDVSNELIREALHPYPEDLLLVSKVGAERDAQGGWVSAQTPADLRRGVEDNLRSLEIDQLGAVNLRRMDEHSDGEVVPLEDQLAEMVALRDEGKIGGIGISTAPLAEVQTAIATAGIVCVQNPFSLLDQHDADVLAACHNAGVAYAPYFPLGSAFPHLPKVVDDPAVVAVADRLGATPAQVGLAWLLAHDDSILLIPGTSSVAHLEQNMAIGDLVLSPEDLADLDAAGT
ncbi:oxidoreductase [Aquihabitans sp. McL0605]|uniref:oxidoreductase n=1 Tax=Aquihabitans sp. McL0605 TaxID=3415671 RepID=UPI003CF6DDA2